jgi:hypothetical protein
MVFLIKLLAKLGIQNDFSEKTVGNGEESTTVIPKKPLAIIEITVCIIIIVDFFTIFNDLLVIIVGVAAFFKDSNGIIP